MSKDTEIDKRIEELVKQIGFLLSGLYPYELTYQEWRKELELRRN